jgi:hypothetical protein
MQIKVISLFIASYLVISTVAAPTTPTPGKAPGGALPEPVGGVVKTAGKLVNGVPVAGPVAAGVIGGVAGQ